MQDEILKRVKVTQGIVSIWLNAKAVPSVKKAVLLHKYFGFPYEIWGDKEKIHEYLVKNNLGLTRNAKAELKKLKKATNAKRG